ncbi:thiamine-phosphate pyrophosphorylase [Helicobacter vulpis]|uniref:thiamine-phosphate pyrophosphorylase n=1 Tax=Helicobacter vulpis TaxID=2316076 RepID=UPI0013CE1E47|nr:thiamine-phosphate pyrophosphorylase [Helicobacter vulpis]
MSLSPCSKLWGSWEAATTKGVERLLDANLNRFKEGVRVVEDIARYLYNHPTLALQLKTIRHDATDIFTKHMPDVIALYAHRDSAHDVLQTSDTLPTAPLSLLDMLQANFKRAQESARVLEEGFKMLGIKQAALSFKALRYALYSLEKESVFIGQTSAQTQYKHLHC